MNIIPVELAVRTLLGMAVTFRSDTAKCGWRGGKRHILRLGPQAYTALVGDLIGQRTSNDALQATSSALFRQSIEQGGTKVMTIYGFLARPSFGLLASGLAVGGMLLLVACAGGSGGGLPTSAANGSQPSAPPTQPAAQPKQPPAQPTPAAAAKGGATSAAAQVDACKLLTKAEVESAAGKPLGEPVSKVTEYDEPSYASSCGYSAPGFEAFVSSTVFVGGDAAQAKQLYQTHKNAPGITAAPMAGIGEDAFWVAVSRTVTVLKGKYEVRASVVDGGQEAVNGLAAKMLERLP